MGPLPTQAPTSRLLYSFLFTWTLSPSSPAFILALGLHLLSNELPVEKEGNCETTLPLRGSSARSQLSSSSLRIQWLESSQPRIGEATLKEDAALLTGQLGTHVLPVTPPSPHAVKKQSSLSCTSIMSPSLWTSAPPDTAMCAVPLSVFTCPFLGAPQAGFRRARLLDMDGKASR